jgi:phage-related holin
MKNFPVVTEAKEIIDSVLSLNLKPVVLIIASFGGFTFGSLTGFVTDWIYTPAVSFYALLALITADHVSGVYRAWIYNRFETRKALRIIWTLLTHVFLLSFASNLAKGSSALYWLDEGVFVPLVIVNLLSFVKNLSLLGFVKKEFASILYRKVDLYKNDFVNEKKPNPPSSPRLPDDGC